MPVTTASPINTYTANGSATDFAYTFRILDEDDLKVYKDGVVQASGYTVSGVGVSGGGTVAFTVAPANGVAIRLQRVTTFDRTSDYQEGAGLTSATLDNDFDRVVMMVQEIDATAVREEPGQEYFDVGNRRIINVLDPTANQDAATKYYVDNLINTLTVAITFNVQYSQITALDGTFTVLERASIPFTISNAYYKTDSGTVTAAVKINGVDVTGLSALSVSSVQGSANASAANSVAVGDRVEITLSSNAAAVDLSISLTCVKVI